jgi:hypothetical protein
VSVDEVIALHDDVSPDGNGTFRSFGSTVMNNAGDVLFGVTLSGTLQIGAALVLAQALPITKHATAEDQKFLTDTSHPPRR